MSPLKACYTEPDILYIQTATPFHPIIRLQQAISHWQLGKVTKSSWQSLSVTESYWQLLRVTDSYWESLTVTDNHLNYLTDTERKYELFSLTDSQHDPLTVTESHWKSLIATDSTMCSFGESGRPTTLKTRKGTPVDFRHSPYQLHHYAQKAGLKRQKYLSCQYSLFALSSKTVETFETTMQF